MDKPAGLTSHDVVATLRATTGIKKVGHTGTLDPFATGVLPLAIGRATRLIQYLDEDLKVYEATILLGTATDTGDPTGEVLEQAPVPELDQTTVHSVLMGFRGTRMQVPPRYSAVKINGKRLYKYARAGEDVEIPARPVRVDSIDLVELMSPRLRVRIQCGRGTYARVLAEEIARALGTVGHLETLRRTCSGNFLEAQALSMNALSKIVSGVEDWKSALKPARGAERVPWNARDQVAEELQSYIQTPSEALCDFPEVEIPETSVPLLLQSGQLRGFDCPVPLDVLFKACHAGEMLALMRLEARGPRVVRMLKLPDQS
jgi:tRNA pseudouridine55 synthase